MFPCNACWKLGLLDWTSGLSFSNSAGFICTTSTVGRSGIPFFSDSSMSLLSNYFCYLNVIAIKTDQNATTSRTNFHLTLFEREKFSVENIKTSCINSSFVYDALWLCATLLTWWQLLRRNKILKLTPTQTFHFQSLGPCVHFVVTYDFKHIFLKQSFFLTGNSLVCRFLKSGCLVIMVSFFRKRRGLKYLDPVIFLLDIKIYPRKLTEKKTKRFYRWLEAH